MTAAAVIPISNPRARHSKRGRMAYLTPEETLAVLKAAREHSRRDWAMILVAYRHGLRASEVCGLRLGDVDLKDGAISIQRLKGSMRTVQPLYAHRGQPLLDEVAALRSWLKIRPPDGSNYLFTSQKGGRLDRTQFFRIFQSVADAAGLPAEKRHPHVLKHSLASHLVAGNVNLALVKQALGHRSIMPALVDRKRSSYRRPSWRVFGQSRARGTPFHIRMFFDLLAVTCPRRFRGCPQDLRETP